MQAPPPLPSLPPRPAADFPGPPPPPLPGAAPGSLAIASSATVEPVAAGSPPAPPQALPPPPPSSPLEPALGESTGQAAAGGRDVGRQFVGLVVSMVAHVITLLVLALIVTGANDRPPAGPVLISSVAEEPETELEALEPVELEIVDPPAPSEPVPEIDMAVAEAPAIDVDPAAASDAPLDAMDLSLGPNGFETIDMMAELRTGERGGGPAGPGVEGFGGEVGRRLAKAGARSGAIQVSLAWNNFNDIDLHVVAPSGERLFFGHPFSVCGGHLDVDMNAPGPVTREAVENIYWPARAAPLGTFKVYVHHFAQHDRVNATPFEIHVLVDGVRQSYTGQVSGGEPPALVAEFTRQRTPPAAPPASEDGFRE